MNRRYAFFPLVAILIVIATLLGFKSKAQNTQTKQIEVLKVKNNDSVEFIIEDLLQDYEGLDSALLNIENLFDPLNEFNVESIVTDRLDQNVQELMVELQANSERSKKIIVIADKNDEVLIEREGEVVFIDKEKYIDDLNSELHIEYGDGGKKTIVIETKILLDEQKGEEINELNSKGLMNIDKSPEFEYMRFYPNPANDVLNISFMLNEPADAHVRISNMLGQIMYEEILSNFSGKCDKIVDVSAYKQGAYLLSIQHDKRNISKKIIVE